MYFVEDEHFARALQTELNVLENCSRQKKEKEKENFNPTDAHLEYIDPTPSIHDLFVRFDKKFFWGSLGMVEVKWSHRMTSCAGICYFQGKRGLCHIALSAPLLSLRPRKDLVETLLHEMIHAYLFVTDNYKDRDDHGPEFHKHMYRINKEAGTNITVRHSFIDEVHYYQKHIWRCNGPCRNKKPYFGFVQRAMNRAPGPSDRWWNQHKLECNGTFIKITEPDNKPKKSTKRNTTIPGKKSKDIRDFFTAKESTSMDSCLQSNSKNISNIKTFADLNSNKQVTSFNVNKGTRTVIVTKTNNSTTKVKSSGSPIDKNNQGRVLINKTKITSIKDLKEEQTCNGAVTSNVESKSKMKHFDKDVREVVRDAWANRFLANSKNCDKPCPKKSKINCLKCGGGFSEQDIELHVEKCVQDQTVVEESKCDSQNTEEIEPLKHCPICNKKVFKIDMKEHLENCANCSFINGEQDEELENEVVCQSVPCPCCYKWFSENEMNSHLDDCLTMIALKEENGVL